MKEDEIRKREALDEYLRLVSDDIRLFFDRKNFVQVGCPACQSRKSEPEFSKDGFQYVSCSSCATLFVTPRPHRAELDIFYTRAPSSDFWMNELFFPVKEARREKIFRPRAEYVSGLIKDTRGTRIGDIGAGFGLFLEEMRKKMPSNRYVAIEPSFKMAEICRESGFETLNTSFEEVEENGEQFDFLTAFELLEHLFDPESFIKKASVLLKNKGYLFITSLNGLGFDILLLHEKSKSVSAPHHLNFLNPVSAVKLLEKCGFEVIAVSTPGKLDWSIVEGMIKNDGVELGRFWGSLAYSGSDKCKEELQNWISGNNLSSHMWILSRKAEG